MCDFLSTATSTWSQTSTTTGCASAARSHATHRTPEGREAWLVVRYDDAKTALSDRTGDIVAESLGGLVHRGRRDRQLKINGYRIEPGDVESAAVEAFEARAIAFAFSDGGGWGLAVESAQIDPVAARAVLARRLPHYLVPDIIAGLPSFPHTAHGKVDAAALSDIVQAQRTGIDEVRG